MIDHPKTKEKSEGKPTEKPKQKEPDRQDWLCLTETLYNMRRYQGGQIIKAADLKVPGKPVAPLRAYGVIVPASEGHKYEKKLFNGEARMVPKNGREE